MIGWYALLLFLAAGAIFTAVTSDASLGLAALLGMAITATAAVVVARSAPVDQQATSTRSGLAAAGAVVGLGVIRMVDSGLLTHATVCLALGILAGALWRRDIAS